MSNDEIKRFDSAQWSKKWHLLTEAAKRALVEQGYSMERVPGRGLSNIWKVSKGGKTQVASIKTTQDRWFAFSPLNDGTEWKTLDDADIVVVAAVDDRDDPTAVETYIFPADEVHARFNSAYSARTKAGQTNKDNYGMWVSLDRDERGIPTSVGSGIVDKYPPVATYQIEELAVTQLRSSSASEVENLPHQLEAPATIGEVMAWAREQVAVIAGVDVEAVKLDLKVEY
jgi:hypothetical protein